MVRVDETLASPPGADSAVAPMIVHEQQAAPTTSPHHAKEHTRLRAPWCRVGRQRRETFEIKLILNIVAGNARFDRTLLTSQTHWFHDWLQYTRTCSRITHPLLCPNSNTHTNKSKRIRHQTLRQPAAARATRPACSFLACHSFHLHHVYLHPLPEHRRFAN